MKHTKWEKKYGKIGLIQLKFERIGVYIIQHIHIQHRYIYITVGNHNLEKDKKQNNLRNLN